MSNVIFMDKDGPKEFDGKEMRRIDLVYIAELPPGDWKMALVLGSIVIADKSGNSPPMRWDGKEWHTLKPDESQFTIFEGEDNAKNTDKI